MISRFLSTETVNSAGRMASEMRCILIDKIRGTYFADYKTQVVNKSSAALLNEDKARSIMDTYPDKYQVQYLLDMPNPYWEALREKLWPRLK